MTQFGLILPAGGSGTRLGGTKKQFRTLADEPVLVKTIRAFFDIESIAEIVVAVPDAHVTDTETLLTPLFQGKIKVCAGGKTRQASVFNAFQKLDARTTHVLVHDAVRPFIRPAEITEIMEVCIQKGSCVPVLSVVDTLRKGKNGYLGKTVSREELFRMQTPQAFEKETLIQAYFDAILAQYEGTDDCEFMQRIGQNVAYIEGNPLNIKITTPQDWEIAELLFRLLKNMEA